MHTNLETLKKVYYLNFNKNLNYFDLFVLIINYKCKICVILAYEN